MRRFLQVLGGITLLVLVVAAVGIGSLFYFGGKLDAESKAYVDDAVIAIAKNWDKAELLNRSAPELEAKVTSAQLDALFATFSRVGPLTEYQGSRGEAHMNYVLNSGWTVSATYMAIARFQNGSGTFRVILVNREDRWMIYNFSFDAELSGARPRPA